MRRGSVQCTWKEKSVKESATVVERVEAMEGRWQGKVGCALRDIKQDRGGGRGVMVDGKGEEGCTPPYPTAKNSN
jgi:hypothetical protein